jgi:hypothetical protein
VRTFERDYVFAKPRKFELDFAWTRYRLGLEIEGGLWVGGAHSHPQGVERDIEKGNLAVLAGWRVLRATGRMVEYGEAIEMIEGLIGLLSVSVLPPQPRRRPTSRIPRETGQDAEPVAADETKLVLVGRHGVSGTDRR